MGMFELKLLSCLLFIVCLLCFGLFFYWFLTQDQHNVKEWYVLLAMVVAIVCIAGMVDCKLRYENLQLQERQAISEEAWDIYLNGKDNNF